MLYCYEVDENDEWFCYEAHNPDHDEIFYKNIPKIKDNKIDNEKFENLYEITSKIIEMKELILKNPDNE